jgi:MoxR-like ATPase
MTAIAISNLPELESLKSLQISIISPESKEEAAQYLVKIDKAGKQLVADVKALKAPHKAAIEQIDAAVKPWQQLLVERKDAIGSAILAYNRRVADAVAAANAKALEKYEVKVEKQEAKAVAQGRRCWPLHRKRPSMLTAAS